MPFLFFRYFLLLRPWRTWRPWRLKRAFLFLREWGIRSVECAAGSPEWLSLPLKRGFYSLEWADPSLEWIIRSKELTIHSEEGTVYSLE